MSEPELYMPDTNQSFDLPRWQTQVDPLSSTAQAAHAAQSSYHYSGPPPPPPQSFAASPQRLQSSHQLPVGQSRQPRISQLLEQDQSLSVGASPYSPTGSTQLARSASLSAASSTSATRARRHHQPEDLEGAFHVDNQSNQSQTAPRQPPQRTPSNFYPTGYQQQALQSTAQSVNTVSATTDSYQDMYYNNSVNPSSKRPSVPLEPNPPARAGRSPLRGPPNPPNSGGLLDPYSPQSQYSPTTSAAYSYGPPSDQRTHAIMYSHSRSHSQVKNESMTSPSSSPYPSQTSAYGAAYPMNTSSPNPTNSAQTHLSAAHPPPRQSSVSNPSTPLSYMHSPSSQYYPQDQAMAVDPPPKRRPSGFRRVRNAHDLQPRLDVGFTGRRMSTDGVYLSPLRQLTTNIVETYHICNPQFRYESAHNPRRVLTKPSKPAHNDGYDNDDYDYILYVNDWLGTEEGHKYLILDILGQGTFGQVVKCQNMKTHEIVAVKVVKNKPAYFNQSMMEVTILEMLNKTCDPNDEHHILRLRDSFIHRNHLCLVFELLSSNLYELIKQNQFQGLSTQLVKVFMAQLLDALSILKDARLIHCDLKPENILLKSLQSPEIKVIDFGSACHERQTVYTYIQSRFYRSPEVLLGMSYTAAIDMWSLGCIAVELFLGLPLFPGTSEYNQLSRIIDMLGMPALSMLNIGKQTSQFFDCFEVWNPQVNQNEKKYRLKSLDQYSREHNTNEQPGKQYFKATSLPELINTAPMHGSKSGRAGELEKELNNRASFIDFCKGLLDLNPVTRWTPQQARLHPFITGEKFTKPFVPDGLNLAQQAQASTAGTDPKRPYGGLVPSQPKGTRAYQDAAAYNHHLAQHQVYTAQAQAASQAATAFRNPYITPPNPQQISSSSYASAPDGSNPSYHQQFSAQTSGHRLSHQTSTGQISVNNAGTQYGAGGHAQAGPSNAQVHLNPNVASGSYYPSARARANTINQLKDVPPALARLHRMDNIPRDALTPVLNRDDAMQEWERRQSGKQTTAQSYPQIEYLQQQAEMAAASGTLNWNPTHRYPPPPSKLSQSYHPQTIMVDDDSSNSNNNRRDAVMSNVRSAARNEGAHGMYASGGPGVISNPPQAYASNATTAGNRYAATYSQASPQVSTSTFDSLERRPEMGNMYLPMQPDQYQGYPPATAPGSSTTRHVALPAQAVAPSFYGAGIVPSGGQNATGQQQSQQQRNPFSVPDSLQPMSGPKDVRRPGGTDAWPR